MGSASSEVETALKNPLPAMNPPTVLDPTLPKRTRGSRRKQDSATSLSIDLLDTWSLLDLLPRLNELENSVFGPDFAGSPEELEAWAESGCWFCAAVSGQAVVGRRQIFSMLSVLVTTSDSRDRMMAGQSSESQLQPWAGDPLIDNPSIYFASVISASSEHLRLMYQSLSRDLQEFKSTWSAEFQSGFGIASGPAGLNHMARNGFRLLEGCNYRGHYPLMVIDAQSAASRFWQDLLSNKTASLSPRAREKANQWVLFPSKVASSESGTQN